jgi:hypothetical protein
MEKAYKFRIYPNKNITKNRRDYGDSLVNISPLGESSQEPCGFSRGECQILPSACIQICTYEDGARCYDVVPQ